MTFSQRVKAEILAVTSAEESRLSLIAGLVLSCGSLVFRNRRVTFCLASENQSVIDFARSVILAEVPSATFSEEVVKRNFKNKEKLELTIDEDHGEELLLTLGIIVLDKNGNRQISIEPAEFLTLTNEDRIALLKGAFLGAGSVSVPSSIELEEMTKTSKSNGYHFEWAVSSSEFADKIAEVLSLFEIFAKKVERNELYIVYIKESEAISNLIGILGASVCLLSLENDKATREMRNLINRQANCISANIDKSVGAALAQLDAIQIIQNTIGIESLPEPLAEAALARISNPEGSLQDILNVLESKITKGALSQRFKKIIEISKELQE